MNLNRGLFYFHGNEDVSFTFYDGFPIDFPGGVGKLEGTADTVRAPDGVGVTVQRLTVPERNVTINGYVTAVPSAEYRRRLERAFAPLARGRLWTQTEEGGVFYLDCVSLVGVEVEGARQCPRFQVQLMAEYPYWQRGEEYSVSVAGAGTSIAGEADILTDVAALFRAEISATGAAEGVRLAVGPEWLEYSGTLGAGETLALGADSAGRISAKIGSKDVVGLVSGGLKKLPGGGQTITLTAAQNAGTLTAKIFYKEARAGV